MGALAQHRLRQGAGQSGGDVMGKRFLRLTFDLLDSETCRNLSADAFRVLIDMWKRHNGENNGEIAYSWRDAQACLGKLDHPACNDRVGTALRDIEASGLATVTRRGTAAPHRRRASLWRLSEEVIGRQSSPGRNKRLST